MIGITGTSELVWGEELSDWLKSNSKILGSDFIESVED